MIRPPPSDSDDDDYILYDGFCFADEPTENKEAYFEATDNLEYKIYQAISNCEIEKLSYIIQSENDFDINMVMKNSATMLITASTLGKFDIVKFLIEKGANVNKSVETYTPLLTVCNTRLESETIKKIVDLLLKNGANINDRNNYGRNALMLAIKNSQDVVAKYLMQLVPIEDKDNLGWTALFHAIENNRPEIVKMLLEAGVNTNVCSVKGYTPRQVALFHGFQDIVELLPAEDLNYAVPPKYLSYNTYEDLAPKIFQQNTMYTPNYFQDILPMLVGMKCESLLPVFASNEVDLEQFLECTDADLQRLGIEFEFERKRILHGLFKFHFHKWNRSIINTVPVNGAFDLYDLYELIAAYLRHIVILKTSISFIHNNVFNQNFGCVKKSNVLDILNTIKEIKTVVRILSQRVNYINSLNYKPPLLITNYGINPNESNFPFIDILKYSASIAFTIFLYAVKDN